MHSSNDAAQAVQAWLIQSGLPSTILLAGPVEDGHVPSLIVAARIEALVGDALLRSQKGFRPGKEPSKRRIAAALSEPISRLTVERVDPEYLVVRGGGVPELLQRTVTVVGCGSVGSHVATALATSGVGRLLLVDQESLDASNIYRHVLGAADIGSPKVNALAEAIRKRLPTIHIETLQKRVERALDEDAERILGTDLIIIAIGDDTVERRLNDYLRWHVPRVHVWLEPLGLGGHVLSVGLKGLPGCFDCLFCRDTDGCLLNSSSLSAPNQEFQRRVAGCAGAFTPFGSLDAQRTAIEAARESIRLLTSPTPMPALISWVASKAPFLKAGFRLSRRGERLQEGLTTTVSDFQRSDCLTCQSL